MKINLIGNIFGTSGYASHVRQLANAMHEQGLDVRLDCHYSEQDLRQITDPELLMLNREFDEERVSIMVNQPQTWRFALADNPKHFIGYLVWEGDRVPTYWLEYLLDERVKQIWVPSTHVRNAINKTRIDNNVKSKGLMDKVKVVPHGVDTNLFYPRPQKEDRPFTFLSLKGWRGGIEDRGGVQYVLKAFSEEFTDKDNVRLIVKLNTAYLHPQFDFRKELEGIGIEKKDNSPKIIFTSTDVVYKELYKVYNDADIYVCATRAEGFNLPGLESKAMGLPTIQTEYGGQTDYMDKSTDLYLNYKLEEVKGDIHYEGVKWATPDIKHLRELMRTSYDNKERIKEYKQDCLNQAKEFTWTNTVNKIKEFIKLLK